MPIPKKRIKFESIPASKPLTTLDKCLEIWDHPGQPSLTMGRIFFDGLPRLFVNFEKRNEALVITRFKKAGFTIDVRK